MTGIIAATFMKIFTWKQRIVVMSVTASLVVLFGAIGYLIGNALGNARLGIVIGALASYPATQFVLVKAMRRLYKVENPEAKAS